MTEFERTEALNTLLGLDLKVTIHQNPIIFVGPTLTWSLSNGTEVLLERGTYSRVDGYLSALEWVGTEAKVVFA